MTPWKSYFLWSKSSVKLSLKRRDNDNLFQKQAELVKKNEG